jgi:tyrosine-protein phosphatase SIW14
MDQTHALYSPGCDSGKTGRPMTSVFRVAVVLSTTLLFAGSAPIGGAGPQTSQNSTAPDPAKQNPASQIPTNEIPTNQGTKSPAARAIGEKLLEKGVPNFGKVTPTLYRGGLPSDAGFKALARMGVKIVVDTHAASPSEEKEVQKLGMQYVAIPWHCPNPKDDVFAKFLKLLQENEGKKIFVHCRLGDDRTGMMTAAYRIAEEGWTADEAMLEMKAFGFSTVHHFMCPGLASYEKEFPDRLKSNPAFEGLKRP